MFNNNNVNKDCDIQSANNLWFAIKSGIAITYINFLSWLHKKHILKYIFKGLTIYKSKFVVILINNKIRN